MKEKVVRLETEDGRPVYGSGCGRHYSLDEKPGLRKLIGLTKGDKWNERRIEKAQATLGVKCKLVDDGEAEYFTLGI